MIFAARDENTLIISSATTFEEYEVFKGAVLADKSLDAAIASRVALFTDDRVKSFQFAPLLVNFADDAALKTYIGANNVSILNSDAARSAQRDMMEDIREKLADEKTDRRTLEEIHGLDVEDPWDRSDEKGKEASKKLDERMKELRKTGGITDDSFGGKAKKGLNVHRIGVSVDQEGKVEVETVNASKNTMTTFRLQADAAELEKIFDLLKIPENRIEKLEDGSGVEIMLHNYQIKLLTDALDNADIAYSLTKIEGDALPDLIAPGTYWQLAVAGKSVQEVTDALTGIRVNIGMTEDKPFEPVYSAEAEGGSVFMFAREKEATSFQTALKVFGVASEVTAVNQKGQPIIAGALPEGVTIVDMDATPEPVADPRPWNSRSKEWPKRGKAKIEEAIKGIKGEEFVFTVQNRQRENDCLVWFAPMSWFKEKKGLYHDGPLFLEGLLGRVDAGRGEKIEEYLYRFRRADEHILTAELCQVGFKESWMFRLRINTDEDI